MIKKNNPKTIWGLISILIIPLIYFFSRFQNLIAIPIFCDEAIYIRWSQLIRNVETLRFIPLTDGKQPLFMWITASMLKFFNDPLISGRLVSIMSGFGIMLGIFFVTTTIISFKDKEINPLKFLLKSVKDNYRIGLISSLIYIFLPFSFFFDRMALPDNLLSFFGIWSLLFTFLLAKFKRLDLAMILGVILGFAWLTKSPAIYFIVLSFFTFIILNFYNFKKIFYSIISTIIAFAIYNLLRLGPQFQMIAIRNKDYIWSISDLIKHPLDPLIPHLWDIVHIYTTYISIPLLLVLILSFFVLYQILNTKYLILLSWWFLPLLANAIIAKVFTARYILFTLPPLIILLTLSIKYLSEKFKFNIFLITILLCLPNIFWITKISTQPQNISLPSTEKGYLSDWTSGWGIKEASIYLQERAKVANVIVGTEGYFGTLPDGLQAYTDSTYHLTIFGVGLGFDKIPEKLIDAKNHGDEVYILMNESRLALLQTEKDTLTLVKIYSKPGKDNLLLYKL